MYRNGRLALPKSERAEITLRSNDVYLFIPPYLECSFFPIGGFVNLVVLHLNYLFWVDHSVCKMDALWKQKATMRKVIDHSEEIYLFVMIN